MGEINCICLKYGTAYSSDYVNRLAEGLRRHTDRALRMFCMTDDPQGIASDIEILSLPEEPFTQRMETALKSAPKRGRLKKLSLFRSDLIPDLNGPLLVLDLDIVITGSVDALFEHAPGKIVMRREWRKSGRAPSLGHGSVERIDPKRHGYLYDFMLRDPEAAVAYGYGSEQSYTSRLADEKGDLAFYPDKWIASFKYDCRPRRPFNLFREPRRPEEAKVVCFHGRPKMPEAIAGYRANPLQSTRACAWLKEAWG